METGSGANASAAVVLRWAIKRTVALSEVLMLAMPLPVLAILWALAVVMAKRVGRVGMAARKSGCYLTTERELLDRASYLQYLRLGIYFFLAHNDNAPKISLNNFWYSFARSLADGKISLNSIQMCLPESIASNIFLVWSP